MSAHRDVAAWCEYRHDSYPDRVGASSLHDRDTRALAPKSEAVLLGAMARQLIEEATRA